MAKGRLISLADVDATLHTTLSYFIEPGSGQIGWKDKYRYASHSLRFDVSKPGESWDEFEKRINVSVRDEDEARTSSGSGDWFLGVINRNVCSIHSDYEYASAIEPSDIEFVAVYPVIGWWRSRKYLGRVDSEARYSLRVSIEMPGMETDLYSEITQVIEGVSATATPSLPPAYSKSVSRKLELKTMSLRLVSSVQGRCLPFGYPVILRSRVFWMGMQRGAC